MNVFRKALSWCGDAAYKLARVSRTNSNWQPTSHHAEEAIKNAWDLLSARTRDLAINTPTGKRISETLSDLIVGSGIQTYATPFSSNIISSLDSKELLRANIVGDLEYGLESDEFFDRWTMTADADGDSSWHEMERLACYELINAGNAMFLECALPTTGDREIPLCYQLIERDQLDVTKDRPRASGQTRILNGIEYDGRNRKIAYHVYGGHPSSTYDHERANTSARIPAARIIHVYLRFRPTQRSGTPWTQEAAQAIRDTDWYLGSELTSAALGSVLTFIHKSRNHTVTSLADDTDDEDTYGNPLLKLGPGLIFKGDVDDDIAIAESKRPSREAAPFIQEMRTEQSMGAGLSPSRLTRDYRNHSYTSARAAHLDDDAHIRPLQRFIARKLSIPVRRRVNAQAAGMGLFATVTPRQFRADQRKLQQFEALGPGREQLDPENETEAALAKLRSGLSTLQIENGRRQQHWIRVLLQRAIEENVIEALGLTLDYSKGQGGERGVDDTADEETDVDQEQT